MTNRSIVLQILKELAKAMSFIIIIKNIGIISLE